MKKVFLLFVFLFVTVFARSQSYLPMLAEDNEWNVAAYGFISGPFSFSIHYALGEEVQIDGKTYYTLLFDGSNCNYVREENGITYYHEDGIDHVIYDFNLDVGDTFEIAGHCSFIGPMFGIILEVVDVTTEFIAGQNRKVIEFDNDCIGNHCITEFWIEGIGSTVGFIPVGRYHDIDTELTCFTNSGVTYMFNNYETCEAVAGVSDFFKDLIKVVPNPVSDISILNIPSEVFADQVKVYSLQGRLMFEKEVTSESVYLDRSDLTPGIYFYQVFSNSELIKTGKFMVR